MEKALINLPNFNEYLVKVKTPCEFDSMENNAHYDDFIFFHIEHSLLRSKQREIPNYLIELAISFGKNIETPSSSYYIFSNKYLADIKESIKKKISNLVVIISKEANVTITCFYCDNPIKFIKKKSKHFIN